MSDTRTSAKQVKSQWPVHPLFFATVPTLSLFSSNLTLLPGALVWRPFAVSIACVVILWIIASAIWKDLGKGALFASFVFTALCQYSNVTSAVNHNSGAPSALIYTVIVVVLAGLISWKVRATALLNTFSIVLTVLFAGKVVAGIMKPIGLKAQGGASSRAVGTRLPDVYYIILDGHGREDVLKDLYGIADGTLAQGLRDRGFYVADKSHSNYVQTELSLASSLNMRHLSDLIEKDPGENERGPFDKAIESNAVQRIFDGLGYELIGVTTGFPAITFPQAKTGYSVKSGLSLLETALIQATPLGENQRIEESQFLARRAWLTNAFSAVTDLAGDAAKPKMIVAHILAPHPPFVFGPNGEETRMQKSFSYADGSDFLAGNLRKEDYRKGYAGQEKYIAMLALKMVDAILAKSKTKPIIIIQGDHGPKSGLDQNDLAKTDIDECFPILNAYYGPSTLTDKLYPEISPVNSFRLVFAALSNEKPELLPDKSYYSPFGRPMQLTDVTNRLKR